MQGQLPNRDETEWFRVERRLKKTETTTCKAYKGSGYDRGHVTPSGKKTNKFTILELVMFLQLVC